MANSLSKLASELKKSFDDSDWASIKELDLRVRAELESLIHTTSPDAKKALADYLKRYERIYALLIKGAEEHRSEIVDQLSKIKKESQVADMYLSSSRYRG